MSRPKNVDAVYQSIIANKGELEIEWFIVADALAPLEFSSDVIKVHSLAKANEGPPVVNRTGRGSIQRNVGLEAVEKGYIYFLDDDTILHPNFLNIYRKISPTGKSFTVNQYRCNGGWTLWGNEPKELHVDTGSVCFTREVIGDIRWLVVPNEDGVFIETVYNTHPEQFIFVDEIASYHNYLRP